MKHKWFLLTLLLFFDLGVFGGLPAQSSFPIRTRWVSPGNEKPLSYREWKAQWEARHHLKEARVVYRSPDFQIVSTDSFTYGQDYAYYKALVLHQDLSICEEVPPEATFIVYLNGNDEQILTDEAPRWMASDPNITGLGWFGIELGNFTDPPIAPGDSFTVVFTCYTTQSGYQQGTLTDSVPAIPLPPSFPKTLYLKEKAIPRPPENIRLVREGTGNRLSWEKRPGLSYTIYRRNLFDTLAYHLPRGQFRKIAQDIVDSVFVDQTIDTTQLYGYLLFSKDLSTGMTSGHSLEVKEESRLPEVRAILVQPELYAAIQSRLFTLIGDWENEGAQVVVYSTQFASPEALRDTLRSIAGLRGALLIGDFPVPWFQYCNENGEDYQEFPCDLFFMDLDGIWEDNFHYVDSLGLVEGSDGIYDTHYASFPRHTEMPEIVVGRITPTPGMGPAEEVVNFYLEKLHQYRYDLGGIRQNFRALAFPDDDWHEWGDMLANNYINQVYPEVLSISDQELTSAATYEDRLDDHFSLIHVWVHSWPQGHSFRVNHYTDWDPFYNYQILPAHTNANFFNLFACGNCRYVEDLNCGAIYTLQTKGGIDAIGTTHSGGMLQYDYFYEQLAEGISWGEAFLRTFQYVGKYGFSPEMKGWYYGLTFLGDPFVIPQPPGVSPVVQRERMELPARLEIFNYPNPFNNGTMIEYSLKTSQSVRLTIYNVLGQKVVEVENTVLPPGVHRWYWDGKDGRGNEVAGGVYYCLLRTGKGQVAFRKMVFLK